MTKAIAWVVAVIALTGCGDASVPDLPRSPIIVATDPLLDRASYGWSSEITTTNFEAAAATPLGKAPMTVAGQTIEKIVTDATVVVRGDANPCSTCHAWAASQTQSLFCSRIPGFLSQPTSNGDGTDPINAKPQLLKDLFADWQAAGCP